MIYYFYSAIYIYRSVAVTDINCSSVSGKLKWLRVN